MKPFNLHKSCGFICRFKVIGMVCNLRWQWKMRQRKNRHVYTKTHTHIHGVLMQSKSVALIRVRVLHQKFQFYKSRKTNLCTAFTRLVFVRRSLGKDNGKLSVNKWIFISDDISKTCAHQTASIQRWRHTIHAKTKVNVGCLTVLNVKCVSHLVTKSVVWILMIGNLRWTYEWFSFLNVKPTSTINKCKRIKRKIMLNDISTFLDFFRVYIFTRFRTKKIFSLCGRWTALSGAHKYGHW